MNVNNRCRICLSRKSLISIFNNERFVGLSVKIMSIAKVEISPNDGLPETICTFCLNKLNDCVEFIQLCKNTDLKLRSSILNKKSFESESENRTNDCTAYDYKYSPKSDRDGDLLIDDNNENDFSCKKLPEVNKTEQIKVVTLSRTNNNNKCKKAIKQQCSTCGKVMSSRFRLKTHLQTHTGERPFACPHCKKKFTLDENLKVHMRIHTGEKPLHCSVCGESFAQYAGLAAHRRKHTGQTPYHCALCNKSFRTIGHLQYHTRRHTGEKNFECETCGHAFITHSHLKQHLMTHTGDRPHVCCECGGRFTRASHLKRHMQRIHSGAKQSLKKQITVESNTIENNEETC